MGYDNTVGSRSKRDAAYIAGFLDGDGSLMLQIKKRGDGRVGIRFMATICFYQDSRHEKPLHWIRSMLGIGYVSRRNDGMTELRINGFESVQKILRNLLPYIRFKQKQAHALLRACEMLKASPITQLSAQKRQRVVEQVLVIQNENYVTKRKRTKNELLKLLDLTP